MAQRSFRMKSFNEVRSADSDQQTLIGKAPPADSVEQSSSFFLEFKMICCQSDRYMPQSKARLLLQILFGASPGSFQQSDWTLYSMNSFQRMPFMNIVYRCVGSNCSYWLTDHMERLASQVRSLEDRISGELNKSNSQNWIRRYRRAPWGQPMPSNAYFEVPYSTLSLISFNSPLSEKFYSNSRRWELSWSEKHNFDLKNFGVKIVESKAHSSLMVRLRRALNAV